MKRVIKATINDVAREAGVSTATVSRVLHEEGKVSNRLAGIVKETILKVGYDATRSGSSKRRARKKNIGVIFPDITEPFFPQLIKGIENALRLNGYILNLCDSENTPELEEYHFRSLLRNGIDGIIFIPSSNRCGFLSGLLAETFPIVIVGRTIEGERYRVCEVVSENEEGACQAVKYLIQLGHRRIVYLRGAPGISTEKERFSGYTRAHRETGVEVDESLVVACDSSYQTSYETVARLLEVRVDFSAVFAFSDHMAFGAIKALNERGLSTPADISVVGFDDIPFSSVLSLTTVSVPYLDMGRNAISLLSALINRRIEPPQRVVLKPSLIIRNTSMKKTDGVE